MEDFLRSIKLIDEMSTTFKMTKTEFVSALRNDVEQSDIESVFYITSESFSSGKKMYKGELSGKGFHIRHKSKRGFINAKGTYRSNGDDFIVNTKISAFLGNKSLIRSLMFLGCLAIFAMFQFDVFDLFQNASEVSFPFLIFLILTPFFSYYNLKKGIVEMRKDLKEKFYSIATNFNHSK